MTGFTKESLVLLLLYAVVALRYADAMGGKEQVRVLRPFQKEDQVSDVTTDTSLDRFKDDAATLQAQGSRVTHIKGTGVGHYRKCEPTERSLSAERKNRIRRMKNQSKEQMRAMRIDYKWMTESMQLLEQSLGVLEEDQLSALKSKILGLLGELSRQHLAILQVVQSRLYELSGAGRMVIEPRAPKTGPQEITEVLALLTGGNLPPSAKLGLSKESIMSSNTAVPRARRLLENAQLYSWLKRKWAAWLVLLSDLPVVSQFRQDETLKQSHASERKTNKGSLQGDILHYIWEKVTECSPDLNAIFQVIPQEDRFTYGKFWEIKTWLEECVLEAMKFKYEHDLLNKHQLMSSFVENNNMELTVAHIYNLFSLNNDGFAGQQAFVPDMKFLCNHWYTEHLHGFLSDLGKPYQGMIMKKALQYTVKGCESFIGKHQFISSPKVHKLFLNERLNISLEKGVYKSYNLAHNQKEDYLYLKGAIGVMLSYYQNPNNLEQKPHPFEKVEYLVTHYIIKYIRTYFEGLDMREIVKDHDSIDYNSFERQFEFLDAGLDFHLFNNLVLDCKFFPVNSFKDKEIIKKAPLIRKKRLLDYKLSESVKRFKKLRWKMDGLSKENSKIQNWMEGMDYYEHEGGTASQEILKFLNEAAKNPGELKRNCNMNLWFRERAKKPSLVDNLMTSVSKLFGISRIWDSLGAIVHTA